VCPETCRPISLPPLRLELVDIIRLVMSHQDPLVRFEIAQDFLVRPATPSGIEAHYRQLAIAHPDARHVVAEQFDPIPVEFRRDLARPTPAIVIAQDGPDAQRSLQLRKNRDQFGGWFSVVADEISEKQNEVRLGSIGLGDDTLHELALAERVIVKIRQHRQPQPPGTARTKIGREMGGRHLGPMPFQEQTVPRSDPSGQKHCAVGQHSPSRWKQGDSALH